MEMKADIESDRTETMQFHKIYIQRHENVRFVTFRAALNYHGKWMRKNQIPQTFSDEWSK